MNIEHFYKTKLSLLQAQLALIDVKKKMPLLGAPIRASLLEEESEGHQASLPSHLKEGSEILDKCNNELHQSLSKIDTLLSLLDDLQKHEAHNQVEPEP